ncbi:serine-rich adhesin for platelets isoform X3 [Macrobrachium rosenbergii]|uniref:serine-rich adhesin for platelets isoform X3 n=1 Tax=Macrobrachium rosenbergii TaxID=79674 RepID=UPI0034D3A5E0
MEAPLRGHLWPRRFQPLESRAGESEGEAEGDLEDGVSPPLDEAPPQQEDAAPHPARRPMNAFLIFCKRHRAQVREKYPHLENRQVTKILGEWWADLPAHQKTSYTDLARQYKEAFLRANPDFKWYKIPAQPPRPPPARPSNQKVPRCDPLPTDGAITFGKLADEAQMGGLSTLLSTASTSNNSSSSSSSSSSSNNSSGNVNLGSFSPVYISASSTYTGCISPSVSPLTDVTTLATVSGVNSVTLSSMSTNTNTNISGTNLLSWSESLKRPGTVPAPSTCSSSRAPSNTSEDHCGSAAAIPVTVTPPLVESGSTTMTPPKPPKKRYLHENSLIAQTPTVSTPTHVPPETEKKKACSALLELSQTSPTEEKFKSSPNWSIGQRRPHRNESGNQMAHDYTSEQDIGTSSGTVASGVNPSLTTSHNSSSVISTPHSSFPASVVRSSISHHRNHSSNRQQSVQCDDQPLNLTTETTICASQQQLINNIVEHMVNGPNSVVHSNHSHLSFFHPENLNNNNNESEKSLHKAIDARINGNGNCDVSLFLSKTLDLVIGRTLDSNKSPRKEKILSEGCKNLFAEASKNQNHSTVVDKKKEPQSEQQGDEKKDAVPGSNSDSIGITNPNMRPRKRPKVDHLEDNDVSVKKRKEVASGRSGQGNCRGGLGVVGGRRSRAPRKCKGKRYEELISEGVLQAPRRSRTRNSRWEEVESSRNQESEEAFDESNQQEVEDEENGDESAVEEEVSQAKASEDENSETGRSRTEEGRRRGQRQLRRLRPDDFDLEAKIEALPSLSLDDFTRRKKERKRTSSASSSTTASHSSSTSIASVHSTSVVGSSNRVAAPADFTSDPVTSNTLSTRVNGNVMSSSNINTNGTSGSDGEEASPTPSSSASSTSSAWSQPSPQAPIYVQGGSLSPGEMAGLGSSEGGPLIGSQKRKARKQTITRHDPVHGPLRRDTSVVEQSVLTSITLADLAEVALSQPSMEI